MIRLLLLPLWMGVASVSLAFENFSAVPGGIVGIWLAEAEQDAPRALFGARSLPVLHHADGWTALVGLPRNLAPGYYVITSVDEEDHHESHSFAVRPINRPIYTIEAPDESTLAQIVERHRLALRDMTPADPGGHDDPPDMDFILPVNLAIRFQFGLLNFRDTGYILDFPGLGFDSTHVAPVVNPAFGQVTEVDNTVGHGRVRIHHGAGLFSVFRNLESVSVTPEEWVAKGAPIGRLPARNNVRLLPDWSVALNGTLIDPLLLVSQNIELAPAGPTTLAPR